MQLTTTNQVLAVSNTSLWTSRVIRILAVLFLIFDGVIKVIQHPQAVAPTMDLGYAAALVMPIGIAELICLLIYLWPRTSVLGAILLTGYLGGAVASQVRAEMPPQFLLFPVIIAAALWSGIWLHHHPLRAFLPWQK